MYAQTTPGDIINSGSLYARPGVGYPIDLGSSSADGMGISGVSFIEPNVPGLANPAHWGSTVYGLATGGLALENYTVNDGQTSSSNSLFSANYFQVQLPIIRDKFGISASLTPLTKSSFEVAELGSRITGSGAEADTLDYISELQGTGGVNMLEIGFGWKLSPNISVGYAGSLVFASIDNEYTTDFARDFITVDFNQQTSGIGFGNRFGAMFSIPNLLRENDQLNLGVSASLPITLNAEKIEETDKVLPNGTVRTIVIDEGDGLGDGNIELPMTFNGGITYQPSRIFSISSEAMYQKWSQYTNDFNAGDEQLFDDRYKIGLGFRYFPYITGSDKFLSNFKYRLGASYDAGHLRVEDQRIETIMFSFGLGIFSPRSNSSVDLSFQYGFRGTQDQNLIRENIWGVRLSVNLAELMFFRPKLQ